jgi:hypothetical protein
VSHTEVVLSFPCAVEAHHPSLIVLDVALQTAISALCQAHPILEHRGESPPYDHNASTDEILAQIIVVSSCALFDLIRHYRAVQDEESHF